MNSTQKKYGRSRHMKKKPGLFAGVRLVCKLVSGAGLTVLLSLVCIFTFSVITQCDYFKAQRIYVTGTKQLSKEAVLDQAKVYPGINIVSVNLGVMQKRLLAHPDILEADVGRRFPGYLFIAIKEQQPLAIVDFGKKYLMNTRGEIYKTVDAADAGRLPVVAGLNFSDFGKDMGGENSPHAAVMHILKIKSLDMEKIVGAPIERIHADRYTGITLFSRDQTRIVRLGYGDYEKKIKAITSVLSHMETRYQMTAFHAVEAMKTDRVVLCPMKVIETDDQSKEV